MNTVMNTLQQIQCVQPPKTGLRCAIEIFTNCAAIGSDDAFQHPATQLDHLSAREQMEGAAGKHAGAVPSPERGIRKAFLMRFVWFVDS